MALYVCLYMSVGNNNIIEETLMMPCETGKSTKTLKEQWMSICITKKVWAVEIKKENM